jgi:hypothetical protein
MRTHLLSTSETHTYLDIDRIEIKYFEIPTRTVNLINIQRTLLTECFFCKMNVK